MKFTIATEAATKKTAVGIAVPDLPGCSSAGDTVAEAFDNAREIIDAFCQIAAEEGRGMPAPKSILWAGLLRSYTEGGSIADTGRPGMKNGQR